MTISIEYGDAYGSRICSVKDWIGYRYDKVLGGVGKWALSVPNVPYNYRQELDIQYLNRIPWRRFKFARKHVGFFSYFTDFIGFVEDFEFGDEIATLSGFDANGFLDGRVIAYHQASANAVKSGAADNLMKAYVAENLGSSSGTDYDGNTVTGRDMSEFNFSVDPNAGDGPTVSMDAHGANLLDTLQNLHAASRTAGTPVYFGMIAEGNSIKFRTQANLFGKDRTIGSRNNPVLFSKRAGNLERGSVKYAYSKIRNQAYVWGAGLESDAVVAEAQGDSINAAAAPLARRETYKAAKGVDDATELQDIADAEVGRLRYKTIVNAKIVSTPSTPYGVVGSGWGLGDKVTIALVEGTYDVIVTAVTVRGTSSVDSTSGERIVEETITARVEVV